MVYFLMWIMTNDIFSNVPLVCDYYCKIKSFSSNTTAFCGLFNPGRDGALFISCHIITTRTLNPLHVSASLLRYCITSSRAS